MKCGYARFPEARAWREATEAVRIMADGDFNRIDRNGRPWRDAQTCRVLTPDDAEDEDRLAAIGVRGLPGLAPDFRFAGRFSKTAPGDNADLSRWAFLEVAAGFRAWQRIAGTTPAGRSRRLVPHAAVSRPPTLPWKSSMRLASRSQRLHIAIIMMTE